MAHRAVFLLAVIASLVVAGCAGESRVASAEPDAPYDQASGALEGLVTDEAIVPIANVTVTPADGLATTTDDEGRFLLSFLNPGTHTLTFEKAGYANLTRSVEVLPGEVVALTVRLIALGADVAHHATQEDAGRMMCAADTRPRQFALNVCGAVALFSPATGDDSLGNFTVTGNSSRLADLVFETHWVTNQATGRGLEVFWEAYQRITDPTTFPEGAPKRFAAVSGVSPLRAVANETLIQSIIHAQPKPIYCHVGDPCMIMARTFPRATTLGTSSPVDAAFYLDQRFTNVLTEFYRVPAPPGFSALADA